MIGFGPNGKLQVSENGTGPFEVAKANGNVATATQLAATPQQCSSGYATGVAANGDAKCSTPDTVRLAERAAPVGIANFGIFWFDSACHCPKVIANNGQAVQLGLMNVFNLDANTLEEYNGTNPQVLNIYGTRTDASNYERMSLTYDTADGYQVVKSQCGGDGNCARAGILDRLGDQVGHCFGLDPEAVCRQQLQHWHGHPEAKDSVRGNFGSHACRDLA